MSLGALLLAALAAVTLPTWPSPATAGDQPAPRVMAATTDTVLALRRGDRVVVDGLTGRLSVEGVGGESLALTTGRRGDDVVVRRDGSRVLVTASGRVGRRPVDVTLRLPAWAGLQVEAVDLDVDVTGLDGDVAIETITGDVRVAQTGGRLAVRAVDGEVTVRDTRGSVRISAQADDILVQGPRGAVEALSLDGDITITGSSAPSVRAETQSGDIEYSGAIQPGGRYGFYLHSGDARLHLPANLSARVRASTFHGDFQADFPVVVSGFTSGRAFDFTVGDGGADIVVEVFDGEIRLSRAP